MLCTHRHAAPTTIPFSDGRTLVATPQLCQGPLFQPLVRLPAALRATLDFLVLVIQSAREDEGIAPRAPRLSSIGLYRSSLRDDAIKPYTLCGRPHKGRPPQRAQAPAAKVRR
jgi:hypothetical protein